MSEKKTFTETLLIEDFKKLDKSEKMEHFKNNGLSIPLYQATPFEKDANKNGLNPEEEDIKNKKDPFLEELEGVLKTLENQNTITSKAHKRIYSIAYENLENIYRHRVKKKEIKDVWEGVEFKMDEEFFTLKTENTINNKNKKLIEKKANSILKEFTNAEKLIKNTTQEIRKKINGSNVSDEDIKNIIINKLSPSRITQKSINETQLSGETSEKISQIIDPIIKRKHFRNLEKTKLANRTFGAEGGATQGFINTAKNNGILEKYEFKPHPTAKLQDEYSQLVLTIKIPRN